MYNFEKNKLIFNYKFIIGPLDKMSLMMAKTKIKTAVMTDLFFGPQGPALMKPIICINGSQHFLAQCSLIRLDIVN